MASFRGIITPYREKYVDEAGLFINDEEESEEDDSGEGEDEKSVILNIVNRHYATVKYLIVRDPKIYKEMPKDSIKIDKERIMNLDGFYRAMIVENSKIVEQFKRYTVS